MSGGFDSRDHIFFFGDGLSALSFLLVVVVLFLGLIGLCLILLICGSGFNLGSGGLEAVDEISNRSMMLSA